MSNIDGRVDTMDAAASLRPDEELRFEAPPRLAPEDGWDGKEAGGVGFVFVGARDDELARDTFVADEEEILVRDWSAVDDDTRAYA